ncbi:hypothetical protein D3C76_1163720 [compost metagenome]
MVFGCCRIGIDEEVHHGGISGVIAAQRHQLGVAVPRDRHQIGVETHVRISHVGHDRVNTGIYHGADFHDVDRQLSPLRKERCHRSIHGAIGGCRVVCNGGKLVVGGDQRWRFRRERCRPV